MTDSDLQKANKYKSIIMFIKSSMKMIDIAESLINKKFCDEYHLIFVPDCLSCRSEYIDGKGLQSKLKNISKFKYYGVPLDNDLISLENPDFIMNINDLPTLYELAKTINSDDDSNFELNLENQRKVVKKILGSRIENVSDILDVTSKGSEIEFDKYFLKDRGLSYIHCEWKSAETVSDPTFSLKLKRYKNMKINSIDEPDECLFNPDDVEIDRVLAQLKLYESLDSSPIKVLSQNSNLNRQFLFRTKDIGHMKSITATNTDRAMIPNMTIKPLKLKVYKENEKASAETQHPLLFLYDFFSFFVF